MLTPKTPESDIDMNPFRVYHFPEMDKLQDLSESQFSPL